MFLIDGPYISDLAEKYLVTSQAPVLKSDFALSNLSQKVNFVSHDEAAEILEKNEFRWFYSNSENAISWLVDTFGEESSLARKISLFKDKARFRQVTAALFPEITFRKIAAEEVSVLKFEDIGAPFIIKPTVGFISAGVYRVNDAAEWREVQGCIRQATEEAAAAFPGAVLSGDSFIIESIIEGEEYAVDAYFDELNEPVILNVLHHRFGGPKDMSDRLYLTSARIITETLPKVKAFLADIGTLADLRGLPFHIEIRIDDSGRVRPIEVNPLRFAGWCSTDIAFSAYGLNVYEAFHQRMRPDWQQLFVGKEDEVYGLAVFGREAPVPQGARFDYDAFARLFSNPLVIREIDYRIFPIYAFVFFQAFAAQAEEEFRQILNVDPSAFLKG